MREFGKRAYKNVAYLNFELNPGLKGIFQQDFNAARLLSAISLAAGFIPNPAETLIILDEIQEAPGGLTALKYLNEDAPEFHVMAAGSLLGVALQNSHSFPVGKVDFLDLYPLTFNEFLEAMGNQPLASALNQADWELIAPFTGKLNELLRQYFFVGGMPEVVMAFSVQQDYALVRDIQQRILMAYELDFSKYAPTEIVPRIRMAWNSMPAQLSCENRKFIYSNIRQGARAKEFELALAWLQDSGLIHKIHNVSKPFTPLKAYEEQSAFKVFVNDVGLLSAMVSLSAQSLLQGSAIFTEFKGALTEQFVLQQLLSQRQGRLYYWSATNGRAEVDFLVEYNEMVLPLEVKATENLQAKSLRVYYDKFKPPFAIRCSMSGYRRQSWLANIPLYALPNLYHYLQLNIFSSALAH
jgi:predicted AAA+ superfamily ATPase